MNSASPLTTRSQIVICLAGHIDHGKSSLVRALTGGVVDRLPEEKRRGMTIDLGFAHFDSEGIRFALTDVPGHEGFIHTMVAGALGVDVALLVIAADDSVMPQTREHLAALELLGICTGVIAITKCDLVDDEQLELVHLEVAEVVEPTCLAHAPVIRVSTESGLGVEEVRQALVDAARHSPLRPIADPRFRLAIDRAFSLAGQGAIVTGTVWRGTAHVNDSLLVLPHATAVRIRRLQMQGTDVESVSAGQRAAVNLAGIKVSEIRRGDELVTPHSFEPSRRVLVRVRILPEARYALRHRQSVRVHLGADQTTVQVLIGQDQHEVPPGEEVSAILRCAKPIIADYGQPFILRQLSPERTIGGGTIIAPVLRPYDRLNRCLAVAQALSDDQPQVRLAGYIDLRREAYFDDATQSQIGLDRRQFEAAAEQLVAQKAAYRTTEAQPRYFTSERFQELKRQMVRCCVAELGRRKPSRLVPISVVLSAMKRHASSGVLEAVLGDLTVRGELVRRGDRVGLPAAADLSHRQQQLLDLLLAECVGAGAMPPTLKEFAARSGCTLKDLEPLVQVAADEGRLVRLSSDLAIASEALESLRQNLADYFQHHPVAKIGEIRERWGMTAQACRSDFRILRSATGNRPLGRPPHGRAADFDPHRRGCPMNLHPPQNQRLLPSVDRVLNLAEVVELCRQHGRTVVARWAREILDDMRSGRAGELAEDPSVMTKNIVRSVGEAARRDGSGQLRRVINGTGVVIHTNLGRAPLAAAAVQAMTEVASCTNLEVDLISGRRGRRGTVAESLCSEITGTEAALSCQQLCVGHFARLADHCRRAPGDHLAGAACRDWRLVPSARRLRSGRRRAARGRHDKSYKALGLRGGHRRPHCRSSAGPS